ncbi:cation:dicarboxylate symporter family transporter, partial [Corynebacterium stationis]
MSDTATRSGQTKNKRFGLPQWATGFGAQVIAGLIIGLILGFIASGMNLQWLSDLLSGVGNAYVQLLRVMVPPLIFAAVVTSVANLRKVANAAALAVSTLVWFAITAFLSVLVGIVVALVMRPGINSTVDPSSAADPSRVGSWTAFIQSIVPDNF